MNKKNSKIIHEAIDALNNCKMVLNVHETRLAQLIGPNYKVPPPRKRPPRKPPLTPPRVPPPVSLRDGITVTLNNQKELWFDLKDGGTTIGAVGNVALVATRFGDQYDLLVVNPFPNVGTVRIQSMRVTWPGMVSQDTASFKLNPACGVRFTNDQVTGFGQGGDPDPVVAWHTEMRQHGGEFYYPDESPVRVYGKTQANAGGGQLIYPWQNWAKGPLGTRMAYEVACGYMNRMPIFRWDREAFVDRGKIVPWAPPSNFEGLDRTRSYAPEGYRIDNETEDGHFPLPTFHGFNALDFGHVARAGGVCAMAAKYGLPMAKLYLDALAADAALSWDSGRFNIGARQLAGELGPNFVYWGAADVRAHTQLGSASHLLSRSYAQPMLVLANAVKWGQQPDLAVQPLETMLQVLHWCLDRDKGTTYILRPRDPHFDLVDNNYWHKRQEFGENIPEDQHPDIVKMFELGITLAVVKRIDQLRVYTGNPYMGPHSRLAEIALAIEANFRIRRPELWAIGHEQWNSDAETDWVDLIMGRADMEALRFEAENVKPNGSGYSGQAYSGWRV